MIQLLDTNTVKQGRILGEGAGGAHPPPGDDLRFSNTTGILRKKTMWFIGVEVEQETSTPPPKINPGSAPVKLPISNHPKYRDLVIAYRVL